MNRIPDLHRKYYKTSRNYNYDKVEAKEKGREGILGIWDLRRKKKRGKEGIWIPEIEYYQKVWF